MSDRKEDVDIELDFDGDDDQKTLYSMDSRNVAQEFIKLHGSEIHPVFSVSESDLQEEISEKSLSKFSPAIQRHAEDFLELMDSHRSSTKGSGIEILDLRIKYNWDDVVKAADEAQKAYEKGNPMRRLSRTHILPYTEAVQPFLRLIPNSTWGSVVYGGLRLVFEAYAQLDDRRMKVLKSFLRIPSIIMLAESTLENYPLDSLIYQRAEAVFQAALPAIEATTRWLKQAPVKKQFRAIILGPVYNKSFKEKLQSLDDALNELKEHASTLRDKAICEAAQTVQDVQNTVNETRVKVDELREIERIREQAQEALKEVLAQKFKTAKWMKKKDRDIEALREQVRTLEQADAKLTIDELLDILEVRVDLASQDLRLVSRACRAVDTSQVEIAHGIISGDKMSNFIGEDTSSAIFIEGGPLGSHGRNTTLTLLCVRMIEMSSDMSEVTPAMPIYFFCGNHTSSRDPMKGPTAIMRSLITQLVLHSQPELNFLSKQYRQRLESHHLHTLCDCFCKLFRKLPMSTVVFCIIDGISFFERREWASDCRQVLSCLHDLLEVNDRNPVLKLLITSPARSRYAGNTFTDDCRITLSNDNSNDARYRMTERDMALRGSRPIRQAAGGRMARRMGRRGLLDIRMGGSMTGTDTETNWETNESYSETDMDIDMMFASEPQPITRHDSMPWT